jgi:hypothetical protein
MSTDVGSRPLASFAVVMAIPATMLNPLAGTTIKPEKSPSKLRYLVAGSASIAFAAPSLAGEFSDVAKIASPGERILISCVVADVPVAGSSSGSVTLGTEQRERQRATPLT